MKNDLPERSGRTAELYKLKLGLDISVVLSLLFMVSCNTLPPGKPPPVHEPIIKYPPLAKPVANGKILVKPKDIDGKDAVNYMLTSLATRCRPISAAGKDIPEILNRFTVSQGSVNDLPMEVWQKLIRMKMIKPISNPKDQYAYSLVSEIEAISAPGSRKKKYLWKMRLLQNNPENKEVWNAKFAFVQDN
jgi:hypothetical protein